MKPKLYLETTIPSYLTSWPSRDLVIAMDFLMTWNCIHIANAAITKAVANICAQHALECPVICTPEELIGE